MQNKNDQFIKSEVNSSFPIFDEASPKTQFTSDQAPTSFFQEPSKMYSNEKLFPGRPSCFFFKGKEVPAFVTFSEGGGTNCGILKEIFERPDKLEIYDEDSRNGLTPFVLLDGHGSRFELDF